MIDVCNLSWEGIKTLIFSYKLWGKIDIFLSQDFSAIYVDGRYCILCLGCFPVEGETALFFFAVLLLGLVGVVCYLKLAFWRVYCRLCLFVVLDVKWTVILFLIIIHYMESFCCVSAFSFVFAALWIMVVKFQEQN